MIGNHQPVNLPNFQITRAIIREELFKRELEKSDGVYPYAANLDIHSWMQSIAPLESDLKLVGLYERWVASSLVLTYNKIIIHRDHADEFNYSLNLPIVNTENTYTCFYKSDKPPVTKYLPNGLPYDAYDESRCEMIDEVEILQPTLLNVKNPHAVILGNGNTPRITIALRMRNA